jgi:hypothetical protein
MKPGMKIEIEDSLKPTIVESTSYKPGMKIEGIDETFSLKPTIPAGRSEAMKIEEVVGYKPGMGIEIDENVGFKPRSKASGRPKKTVEDCARNDNIKRLEYVRANIMPYMQFINPIEANLPKLAKLKQLCDLCLDRNFILPSLGNLRKKIHEIIIEVNI